MRIMELFRLNGYNRQCIFHTSNNMEGYLKVTNVCTYIKMKCIKQRRQLPRRAQRVKVDRNPKKKKYYQRFAKCTKSDITFGTHHRCSKPWMRNEKKHKLNNYRTIVVNSTVFEIRVRYENIALLVLLFFFFNTFIFLLGVYQRFGRNEMLQVCLDMRQRNYARISPLSLNRASYDLSYLCEKQSHKCLGVSEIFIADFPCVSYEKSYNKCTQIYSRSKFEWVFAPRNQEDAYCFMCSVHIKYFFAE